MISESACSRLEYAEQIALLDDEAVTEELARTESTVSELRLMIDTRYGGLVGLKNAAKKKPVALDLQTRFHAASLRLIELRRRAGLREASA